MTNNKELTSTDFDNQKMENINNKQRTAVDSIIELCQELLSNHYSISHDAVCSEVIKFCQEQAKEMEKERMIQFCIDWFISREMNIREYYEQAYGGGNK
jgi:hypothetical protein